MLKSRIKQRLKEQKTKVSMESYKRFRIEILQYITQSVRPIQLCSYLQAQCILVRVSVY